MIVLVERDCVSPSGTHTDMTHTKRLIPCDWKKHHYIVQWFLMWPISFCDTAGLEYHSTHTMRRESTIRGCGMQSLKAPCYHHGSQPLICISIYIYIYGILPWSSSSLLLSSLSFSSSMLPSFCLSGPSSWLCFKWCLVNTNEKSANDIVSEVSSHVPAVSSPWNTPLDFINKFAA